MIEQKSRELVVAVLSRSQERGPAVVSGLVDIGPARTRSFAHSMQFSRAA